MADLKTHMLIFGYGGLNAHCHNSIFSELTKPAPINWVHRVIDDDALIDRSRSRALSRFLQAIEPEDRHAAFVMVDHDIQWRPGDLAAIAKAAAKENALVGGLYACRALTAGFSSRLEAEGISFKVGGDKLHKAEYLATGFLAGSVSAVRRILACCQRPDAPEWARITECLGVDAKDDPFYDFFRPVAVPSTMQAGKNEYLSEDWAFTKRATFAEVPLWISETPVLRHWGQFPFGVQHGMRPAPGEPAKGNG